MFEAFLGVNPWTALFIFLNTLTIFFVARHYLFQPVMHMIEQRQTEIDQLYQDAGSAKEEAAALEAQYRQKLSIAAETGERIVKEAVARGQAKEEAIIRQAKAEATAMMDKASSSIAQEKKQALKEAKDEISVIAIAIAEKVIARQLQAADQQRFVDAFIDTLE